jgi:hypothetical protein
MQPYASSQVASHSLVSLGRTPGFQIVDISGLSIFSLYFTGFACISFLCVLLSAHSQLSIYGTPPSVERL